MDQVIGSSIWSVGFSQKAVNGIYSTWMQTRENQVPVWTVDLQFTYLVNAVQITNVNIDLCKYKANFLD